jgi:hypothetical protein
VDIKSLFGVAGAVAVALIPYYLAKWAEIRVNKQKLK